MASPALFSYTLPNCFLGEAAVCFGLTGTGYVIHESSPSGMACVHAALEAIVGGEMDRMLCGICDLGCPSEISLSDNTPAGAVFFVLEKVPESDRPPYGTLDLDGRGIVRFNGKAIQTVVELAQACLASSPQGNIMPLPMAPPVPDPEPAGSEDRSGSVSPEIAIVIPVYNNAATLRSVVIQALEVHERVMVIDDGSIDDAVSPLQDLRVNLLRHPKNLGKGAAILSAAREARRLGMTHIATIDADGQHDPRDLRRFFPLIERYPDAIVVGERNFGHADVPKANRFGRDFSNFWLRLQTGKTLGDAQSGFRVYPLWVLENLKLRERRYAFEIEVLVKAAWAGIELMETDISVYYPQGEDRVTHFRLFLDNLRLSRLNAKLTLRSMLPWPHRKIVKRSKKEV